MEAPHGTRLSDPGPPDPSWVSHSYTKPRLRLARRVRNWLRLIRNKYFTRAGHGL
jgi:hypothetical protein